MSKSVQELLNGLPTLVVVEGLVRAGQRLAEECWILTGKPMKADPRDPKKKKEIGAIPFFFTRDEIERSRMFGSSLDTAMTALERMKERYAGLVQAKAAEAKAVLAFSPKIASQITITPAMSADEIVAELAKARELKAEFDAAVAARTGGGGQATVPVEAKPVVQATKAAPEKAAAQAAGRQGGKVATVKAATAEVQALAETNLSMPELRTQATDAFRVAAEKVRDAGLSDGSVKQAWKQAVAGYEEAWRKGEQGVASLPTTAAAGGGK